MFASKAPPGRRIVLLAAGKGSRMAALGADEPKSLLRIGGEPFAARLLRQAIEAGATEVVVVLGYQADVVRSALAPVLTVDGQFVVNTRFEEDVNIHSLALALEARPGPCFVVEADVWLADFAWPVLFSPEDAGRSVWYTRGPFRRDQLGGILQADSARNITDLRIVPRWAPEYEGYEKLVGVTKIGPAEAEGFTARLRRARDENLRQYWLKPWIDNLGQLPCVARDLGSRGASSVNTPEEYQALVAELTG